MSRSPIRRVVALAVLASTLSSISGTAANDTYLIIDVSGGPSATSYSYTYVNAVPSDLLSNNDYKSSKIVLRRISAGTFTMGSPASEQYRDSSDEIQHSVTLTKDFYMGVFEVTQAQYKNVTGADPSASKGDYKPVDTVSWLTVRGRTSEGAWDPTNPIQDMQWEPDIDSSNAFLGRLARKTGLLWLDLPTQAQWEYACRAGTTGALNNGREQSTDSTLTDLSWYNENANGATHEVGGKQPNAWGLYDMHGNLWEWVRDVSPNQTDPGSSPVTDPLAYHQYMLASGAGRQICGGAYNDGRDRSRSAEHFGSHNSAEANYGFRIQLLCDSASPANNPPTVSITSPANNATFTAGNNVTINATASDSDGTVSKVEFYQGSTKLGEATSSPYSYTWNNVSGGSYTLTAKATDDKSVTTTSAGVNITVTSPLTVSITSPTNGASFQPGANISITANPADTSGTVTKVEFYQGSTKLGEATSSPWTYTWNNVVGGAYSLTAVATDDGARQVTSAAISITIDDQKVAGTVIGTSGSYQNDPAVTRDKAFDGNTSTYFDAPTGDGNWCGLDLGADYAITKIRYYPRATAEARMVGGKFQGSSTADFSSGVVDLYTISSTPPLAWTATTAIASGNGFRYIRYLSPNGGYGNVAEIEFYGHGSGGSGNTTAHGVPYSWLSSCGISTNDSQIENSDPDNDGMPTWQEYYAGTNPTNSASAFRILSTGSSGTQIAWYGTTNSGVTTRFRVYRCTSLTAGTWTLAATNLQRSTTGTNVWTDPSPPSAPQFFYRLALATIE